MSNYPQGTPSPGFTPAELVSSTFSPEAVTANIIDNHSPVNKRTMVNSHGYQISLVQNFVNERYLAREDYPIMDAYIQNINELSSLNLISGDYSTTIRAHEMKQLWQINPSVSYSVTYEANEIHGASGFVGKSFTINQQEGYKHQELSEKMELNSKELRFSNSASGGKYVEYSTTGLKTGQANPGGFEYKITGYDVAIETTRYGYLYGRSEVSVASSGDINMTTFNEGDINLDANGTGANITVYADNEVEIRGIAAGTTIIGPLNHNGGAINLSNTSYDNKIYSNELTLQQDTAYIGTNTNSETYIKGTLFPEKLDLGQTAIVSGIFDHLVVNESAKLLDGTDLELVSTVGGYTTTFGYNKMELNYSPAAGATYNINYLSPITSINHNGPTYYRGTSPIYFDGNAPILLNPNAYIIMSPTSYVQIDPGGPLTMDAGSYSRLSSVGPMDITTGSSGSPIIIGTDGTASLRGNAGTFTISSTGVGGTFNKPISISSTGNPFSIISTNEIILDCAGGIEVTGYVYPETTSSLSVGTESRRFSEMHVASRIGWISSAPANIRRAYMSFNSGTQEDLLLYTDGSSGDQRDIKVDCKGNFDVQARGAYGTGAGGIINIRGYGSGQSQILTEGNVELKSNTGQCDMTANTNSYLTALYGNIGIQAQQRVATGVDSFVDITSLGFYKSGATWYAERGYINLGASKQITIGNIGSNYLNPEGGNTSITCDQLNLVSTNVSITTGSSGSSDFDINFRGTTYRAQANTVSGLSGNGIPDGTYLMFKQV